MRKLGLVFFKGISFVSKLIEKVTNGEYSHVGYIDLDTYTLIECWCGDDKVKPWDYLIPPLFNKKYCWKYSSLLNHTDGTPYTILYTEIPEDLYFMIDSKFRFLAEYKYPYDLVGLLARYKKSLDSKNGFFCSEGVQNILNLSQRYYNRYMVRSNISFLLTDPTYKGYQSDPSTLYNLLLKEYNWKILEENII